jgi:hypothetical protein
MIESWFYFEGVQNLSQSMTHSLDANLVKIDFVSQLAHDVSFGGIMVAMGV